MLSDDFKRNLDDKKLVEGGGGGGEPLHNMVGLYTFGPTFGYHDWLPESSNITNTFKKDKQINALDAV